MENSISSLFGEWMPVRVFHNENGKLVDRTKEAGLSGTNGWWNSVQAVDLRGNGRRISCSQSRTQFLPARIPKGTGAALQSTISRTAAAAISSRYSHSNKNGVSYPLAGRDELVKKIPSLGSKFPSYRSFGASRVEDIFPAADLKPSAGSRSVHVCERRRSQQWHGTFRCSRFRPRRIRPDLRVAGEGFRRRRQTDLLVGGNFYGVPPVLGPLRCQLRPNARGD